MKINKIVTLISFMILSGIGPVFGMEYRNTKPQQKLTLPDAYKALNVNENASTAEIKKAYCKLALASHPDKNPDNPGAEEQFKLFAHAYEILTGKQKADLPTIESAENTFRDVEIDLKQFFGEKFGEIFNDQSMDALNQINNFFDQGGFNNFKGDFPLSFDSSASDTLNNRSNQEKDVESNVQSIESYPISANVLVTEKVLSDGSVIIEERENVKKTSWFGRQVSRNGYKNLTVAQDSIPLKNIRDRRATYKRNCFRNKVLKWTLGLSCVAGATYMWLYHPAKVIAFKDSVVMPAFKYGFAKTVSLAQCVRARLF